MVSRKSAYLVIGGALLLAACSQKKDSQATVGPDAMNETAANVSMAEDVGNDSNAVAPAAPAAPEPQSSRHGKRGNSDTRGAPSTSTTTK